MPTKLSRDVRPKTKKQTIIDDLISQIKTGKLKPGDNLPDNKQLEQIYGAGRATVWEAKNHLERYGIIDPGTGRGGPGAGGRHTTVANLAPYLV